MGNHAQVTAVVLAAGLGSRLGPASARRPKVLLEVGGSSLLDRLARQCSEAGVGEIVVVTGHASEAIETWLRGGEMPLPARTVHNDRYATTSNAESLRLALATIPRGRVIKFDGDVYLHDALVGRLLAAGDGTAVAFDSSRIPVAEDMKLRGEAGFLVEIGKDLPAATASGVTLGVESIDRADIPELERALSRACIGRDPASCWYEDAYRLMLTRGARFRCTDIAGYPWTEIDTTEDLAAAHRLASKMQGDGDGRRS